ncbi:Periplasmic copper-binding protein [Cupriavidus necator]|uniref:Periplasmic copper-binding protein n=1 Tax=Cupriavidus necator TaxID=106590 RepID=A0A1K0IBP2_CUPNE|nr:Periplasmic copper-binding protein [Cupriavidus necator]
MKHVSALWLVLALAAMPAAFAATRMEGMDMKPAAHKQAAQPVPAEIKKIDPQAGKVTLKHGPIEHPGMGAMTMSFPVKDRAALKNVQEGEKVSAMFETVDGKPTVEDMRRPKLVHSAPPA